MIMGSPFSVSLCDEQENRIRFEERRRMILGSTQQSWKTQDRGAVVVDDNEH